MVAIENTLVSDEVFTEKFCCNLARCKGCCCVEGDAGAPLEAEELPLLEKYFPFFKEFMRPEGVEAIQKQGELFDVLPWDGSFVTPLIDKKECAYLTFDENNMAWCAIEKAFIAGKLPFEKGEMIFKKPISCHLFPIRITSYPEYDAVNYFRWDICKDAFRMGRKKNIAVFQFLKEPLIRKYGHSWYEQAEAYYKICIDPEAECPAKES